MKTMTTNIAGACVCSMRIKFNVRHSLQFYHFRTIFSGLLKTHQTVVWARIDPYVLDDNEIAHF